MTQLEPDPFSLVRWRQCRPHSFGSAWTSNRMRACRSPTGSSLASRAASSEAAPMLSPHSPNSAKSTVKVPTTSVCASLQVPSLSALGVRCMSPSSTPKSSSLSERLQADQEAIQSRLVDQTQQLLKQHAETLKKLSSDARRSTARALEAHAAELDRMHRATAARMKWLLLWPSLATVLMSVLIGSVTMAWSMYRLDQIDDAQRALDQAQVIASSAAPAAQQVPHPPAPEPVRKIR